MNQARARKVKRLYEKLSTLSNKAEELRTELEELMEVEQEFFDGLSEASQDSERGQKSSAAIEAIATAIDCINAFTDGSLDQLDEIQG